MGLRLVYDDLDLSLNLPVGPEVTEAIGLQIERCLIRGGTSGFKWRLVGWLSSLLDPDLQPPTMRQMALATAIARGQNLSIPADAIRYRGIMAEFLERHGPGILYNPADE